MICEVCHNTKLQLFSTWVCEFCNPSRTEYYGYVQYYPFHPWRYHVFMTTDDFLAFEGHQGALYVKVLSDKPFSYIRVMCPISGRFFFRTPETFIITKESLCYRAAEER